MHVGFTLSVKKETQVRKLRDDKQRLEAELEEMENKVSRISSMSRQVSFKIMYHLHFQTSQLHDRNPQCIPQC